MFGRKNGNYKMVKYSMVDNAYRVTMFADGDNYMVVVSKSDTGDIVMGGKMDIGKEEADCLYNKLCVMHGIAEK